jgi:CTD kinase subunit gamma
VARPNGSTKRLDKRQIEQRIEEDRERHKRLKETFWAIPGGDDAEFNKTIDEAQSVTSDDERDVAEQAALRERDLARNLV